MNTERLLKLAEFLETKVEPGRFDIKCWRRGDLNECGTAGCAFGWATVCFAADGLVFSNGEPTFGTAYGFDAADDFFDIDSEESWDLFDSDSYCNEEVSPQMVATRIRQMVAEHLSVPT